MNIKIFALLTILFLFTAAGRSETGTETEEKNIQAIYSSFGTILPLTGKYSRLGERSLRGIRTAIEEADKYGSYRVIVKDSMSNAEGASRAYKQLVSEITPMFIVGPVPSAHVEMIENTNLSINQPVAIFPIIDNKTHKKNIIGFHLSVGNQVKALGDYSLRDLKLKHFAVLAPDTKVGNIFAGQFATYINRNGGKIIYNGSYNPDLSDLDVHIKWIESYNIDAIFIPDSAKNSTFVIKNIITDDDITNVIFLGPSTWNSEIFYNLSKNDFDGVIYKIIFTDFIDKSSEEWINFSNLYRALFNEKPGSYEYQVYLATLYFLESDLNRQIVSDNNSLSPKAHILTIRNGSIERLK